MSSISLTASANIKDSTMCKVLGSCLFEEVGKETQGPTTRNHRFTVETVVKLQKCTRCERTDMVIVEQTTCSYK